MTNAATWSFAVNVSANPLPCQSSRSFDVEKKSPAAPLPLRFPSVTSRKQLPPCRRAPRRQEGRTAGGGRQDGRTVGGEDGRTGGRQDGRTAGREDARTGDQQEGGRGA